MNFLISARARDDLRGIYLTIAEDNPNAADRFIESLKERFQILAQWPLVGSSREDFGIGIRAFSHRNYVIYFRPVDNVVNIERVLHGARDLDASEF